MLQPNADVLISALTGSGNYSGGRYHAWIMAEALASRSHNVTFWGNQYPLYGNDFKDYEAHKRIKFHGKNRAPSWSTSSNNRIVIVVPHTERPFGRYYAALVEAARSSARVVLLNFESPNWFNSMSPERRPEILWDNWRLVAQHADGILSSSNEGARFASDYYNCRRSDCLLEYIHPAINSKVADSASEGRSEQIIAITRFGNGNKHKGGLDMLHVLGPWICGRQLLLILGRNGMEQSIKMLFEKRCYEYGGELRILQGISDYQKFTEIKRSRLMLFLSYFEGFGYPPVEAMYCGVPCIAYDLPVLRELGETGVTFVARGDVNAVSAAASRILSETSSPTNVRSFVEQQVGFEAYATKLDRFLKEICRNGKRHYSDRLHRKWLWRWKLENIADYLSNRLQLFK